MEKRERKEGRREDASSFQEHMLLSNPELALQRCLQAFLGRYGVMLENGGKDPSTAAGQELRNTVLDRRQEEARAALFSDWASASYAWNKEETAQGMSPPSTDFWTQILVSPISGI